MATSRSYCALKGLVGYAPIGLSPDVEQAPQLGMAPFGEAALAGALTTVADPHIEPDVGHELIRMAKVVTGEARRQGGGGHRSDPGNGVQPLREVEVGMLDQRGDLGIQRLLLTFEVGNGSSQGLGGIGQHLPLLFELREAVTQALAGG